MIWQCYESCFINTSCRLVSQVTDSGFTSVFLRKCPSRAMGNTDCSLFTSQVNGEDHFWQSEAQNALICMQTLFFLIMGIVFSLSKMKTKRSFRRKLVMFIKMCTKTQNNRKKRSKPTNTTKSLEIKRSHGNKTASQCYLASFDLQSFCFVLILSLISALLFCLFGQCCFYSGNQVLFRYFEFL